MRDNHFLSQGLINRSLVVNGENLWVPIDVVLGNIQTVAKWNLVGVPIKVVMDSSKTESILISVTFCSVEVVSVGVMVVMSVGFFIESWAYKWHESLVFNDIETKNWLGDVGLIFLNVEVSVMSRVEGVDGVAAVGVAVRAAIGVVTVIGSFMSVVTITMLSVGVVIEGTVAIAAAIVTTEVATVAKVIETVEVSSVSETSVVSVGCMLLSIEGTKSTVGSIDTTSVVATIATRSEVSIAVVVIVSVIGLKWVVRFCSYNNITINISDKVNSVIIRVVNVDGEVLVVVSVETTGFTRLRRPVIRVLQSISRFRVLIRVIVRLH